MYHIRILVCNMSTKIRTCNIAVIRVCYRLYITYLLQGRNYKDVTTCTIRLCYTAVYNLVTCMKNTMLSQAVCTSMFQCCKLQCCYILVYMVVTRSAAQYCIAIVGAQN